MTWTAKRVIVTVSVLALTAAAAVAATVSVERGVHAAGDAPSSEIRATLVARARSRISRRRHHQWRGGRPLVKGTESATPDTRNAAGPTSASPRCSPWRLRLTAYPRACHDLEDGSVRRRAARASCGRAAVAGVASRHRTWLRIWTRARSFTRVSRAALDRSVGSSTASV